MERRKYTREFKLAAVRKIVDLGLSCSEVGRDPKVRESMIYNWRKSFCIAKTEAVTQNVC
jgi:transposase-like protein